MCDRIQFPLDLNREEFQAASYFHHGRTPKREYFLGALAMLAVLVALVLVVRAVTGTAPSPSVIVGYGAGCIAFLGLVNTLAPQIMARMFKAHQRNIARSGTVTVTLSKSGVSFKSVSTSQTLAWRAIDEIVNLKSATGLIQGASVYSIPDRCLPEDLAPSQFRAQLETWRAAP